MDESRDALDDAGALPLRAESPMDTHIGQETVQDMRIPDSNVLCAHQRLIDDVRTRSGRLTGKVRCLECGTIFDDPYKRMNMTP